jgi:hypothetical protein
MKGLRMIAGALVMGWVVAGCTPGDEPAVTPSPVPPTTALPPTPTPTPTPQWNEEEQGAADAVQRYLEKWTYLAQNLATEDVNQLREVASDPIANDDLSVFAQWMTNGWHLVGNPSFRVDKVERAVTDHTGTTLRVKGCYMIGESHVVDQTDTLVVSSRTTPMATTYSVLHLTGDGYLVVNGVGEDSTC